jgi:hypothetical protein
MKYKQLSDESSKLFDTSPLKGGNIEKGGRYWGKST